MPAPRPQVAAAQLKRRVRPLYHAARNAAWRPAGRRAFQAAVEPARASGEVKINLGSGGEPLAGWVNCDVVWRAPTYLDATTSWPVPPSSVDFVYADNVIEHLTLERGRRVFAHAFTALRPGGVFRLATPDVEAVARQYLENGELARLGMQRNREQGRDLVHPVQLIQQVFVGAQHYLGFCYDDASLSAEMQAVGFEARRQTAGQSDFPQLRDLEVRTHPAEVATELVVEGRKPTSTTTSGVTGEPG
jgi:predicted SAM-dependent methyltransferase